MVTARGYCDELIHIKIIGDVNSDRVVDSLDIGDLNKAYGSAEAAVHWNPECDFNRDDNVDVMDLFDLGKNYGRTASGYA